MRRNAFRTLIHEIHHRIARTVSGVIEKFVSIDIIADIQNDQCLLNLIIEIVIKHADNTAFQRVVVIAVAIIRFVFLLQVVLQRAVLRHIPRTELIRREIADTSDSKSASLIE